MAVWLSPSWTGGNHRAAGSVAASNICCRQRAGFAGRFTGTVLVEAAAPLILTLPPTPTTGQAVTVKDALGNAGTHPITVSGGAALIEGAPTS